MKRRRGFTLIELMIVIAILAVVCGSFFVPLRGLLADLKKGGVELQRQERMTTVFLLLERAFAEAAGVQVLGGGDVRFSGGPCSALRRQSDGRALVVDKQGCSHRLDFPDGMVFGPFTQVDGVTVRCDIRMPDASFPMFWRCKK